MKHIKLLALVLIVTLTLSSCSFVGSLTDPPDVGDNADYSEYAELKAEYYNEYMEQGITAEDDIYDNFIHVELVPSYADAHRPVDIELFNIGKIYTANDVEKYSKIFGEKLVESYFKNKPVIEFIYDASLYADPDNGRETTYSYLDIHLKYHSKETVIEAVEELNKLDYVLIAEAWIVSYTVDDAIPSDEHYGLQWGLNGTYGIDAEEAWNIPLDQEKLG